MSFHIPVASIPDRSGPTPSRRLEQAQIHEVQEAALRIGLTQSRTVMMSGISPAFIGSLEIAPSPAAQTLSDLHALNRAGELEDGTDPLETWLRTAVQLAGPRRESAVFRRALEQITEKKRR